MVTAVLVKSLKNKNKIITGTVIQDGFTHITMVVTNPNGAKEIKRFKKSDWTINYR